MPKPFITAVLMLCAAIYVAELSGHWDQTLRDANDEAGVVAIVLCVGAVIGAAAAFVDRFQPSTRRSFSLARPATWDSHRQVVNRPATVNTGPPLSLRI